jgi:RNA polymerase primary sigma factor
VGARSGADRLSALQERDLVIAATGGDADACRRLVEAFRPAILGLTRHFHHVAGLEHQDLVQEGVAALLFAARRYDSGLGTPFWAYASFWVRKAMQELIADLARPVALSDRAVKRLAALRAARQQILLAQGTEATTEQLRQATGLSRAQVESLQAADRPARSMEERLGADGHPDGTVGTRIVDPGAEAAFDRVLDQILNRHVRGLADGLGERERTVIRSHFGLGVPAQTLTEIGSALGLTAERTRQIEVVALSRLRAALAPTWAPRTARPSPAAPAQRRPAGPAPVPR